MFQKKILAVAVAGALGIGASGVVLAQEDAEGGGGGSRVGNVEIYGRLYPEFTILSGSGATSPLATGQTREQAGLATFARTPTGLNAKSRNSIDASNSRLGFRGSEDLGGGLAAIWQIESTIALDQGNTFLATRESFVGLRGNYGTVRLGFMDTVYKELGDPIRFMGVASGNHVSISNIISSRNPFGNSSAASFHLRQPNGLWYETPNMSGVKLYAQYSPDQQESAPAGDFATKREFWSLGARYRANAWYLALAHEIHKDFFGGSANVPTGLNNSNVGAHSDDSATRGTVMYTYGPGRVSLDYAWYELSESGQVVSATSPNKFKDYKNTRWGVTWEHRWSGTAWRTAALYASSAAGSCSVVSFTGAGCSTSGLNGYMVALGAEYSFSKRTALFALYSHLNNGKSSSYRNAENLSPYETGMDVTQVSFGIRHDY